MKMARTLPRDLFFCALLGLGSAALGLGFNFLREEPLALIYTPPGASFQKLENLDAWKPGIQVIDVGLAKDLIDNRGALVLDARPDLFHEFGHLPGAENLSRKNYETDIERLRPTLNEAIKIGVPFLLYCAHLHCPDALEVANRLLKEGAETLLIYKGGYDEWESMGLKTEQGK